MVPAQIDNATGHALVSRIEKAQRRTGNYGRLNVWYECPGQVRRFDRRNVDIPTQSQVRRQPGSHPVSVLYEQCGMPVAQQPVVRSVLLHGVDLAGDEIAQRIARGRGRRGLEVEDAEVIQVTDDHIFVQCQLGAEIDRVFAFRHADQVAQRIEVRGGYRSGERSTHTEISRYGQL